MNAVAKTNQKKRLNEKNDKTKIINEMKNDRSLGRRIFLFNVDIEWVVEVGIQGYHPFFF